MHHALQRGAFFAGVCPDPQEQRGQKEGDRKNIIIKIILLLLDHMRFIKLAFSGDDLFSNTALQSLHLP